MNDFMSLGIHRLWKDHFVRTLNPGRNPLTSSPSDPQGWNILDIAGGTGDIAFRMLDHASTINNDAHTRVTISDINPDMLAEGKKRSLQTPYARSPRLSFLEAKMCSRRRILRPLRRWRLLLRSRRTREAPIIANRPPPAPCQQLPPCS